MHVSSGLMHWPAPMKARSSGGGADTEWDWRDTWKAMEKIYMEHPDKVKAIGVSNFSEEFFDELLKVAKVIPAVNQLESHPYVSPLFFRPYVHFIRAFRSCNQTSLINYCLSKGVAVTAYSPLGSQDSPLHENPTVKKIADKYGASTANVLVSLQANKPGVTGERLP